MSCRRKIRASEIRREKIEKILETIKNVIFIVVLFGIFTLAIYALENRGSSEAPTARIKGGIQTENIITEEIQVEEIQVEEIQIRTSEDSMRTLK